MLRRHITRALLVLFSLLVLRATGGIAVGRTQPNPTALPKEAIEVVNTTDCGQGASGGTCAASPHPAPNTCLPISGQCKGSQQICRFEWSSSGTCGDGDARGDCQPGGYCRCRDSSRCGPDCRTTCASDEECQFERCVRVSGPGPGPGPGTVDPCAGVVCPTGQTCIDGRCQGRKTGGGCAHR
jgi:hypothetical protein